MHFIRLLCVIQNITDKAPSNLIALNYGINGEAENRIE